jgi:hypothetical protein
MARATFLQADALISTTRYIIELRNSFAPGTKIVINELGSILPGIMTPKLLEPIPDFYWNMSGAMFAYAYGNLSLLDVDLVNASELIDYPSQVASTTLLDWDTGAPNARYLVAKLVRDHLGPGDRPIKPFPSPGEFFGKNPATQLYAQGYVSPTGQKKLLVVNKAQSPIDVQIPGADGAALDKVEAKMTRHARLAGDKLSLGPFEVAILTF